jgi:hypothetical protein
VEMNLEKGLSLAQRVHPKYKPVFEKLDEPSRAAVALYFLPHGSRKEVLEVTRPRVIKWNCPFADQSQFPSGHRYSISLSPAMSRMKRVYEHLAGRSLVFHGGSWRLPPQIAGQFVIGPFSDLCRQYSLFATPCKANLISTP